MSGAKRQFSDSEKYAVYTVHREKCWLCLKKLDIASTEIDHIFPESLINVPTKLFEVLTNYGLPQTFSINSYENWLPACRSCNSIKSNLVFEFAPIIQVWLQYAKDRSERAREIATELVSNNKISRAFSVLKRAQEQGIDLEKIKPEGIDLEEIMTFAKNHEKFRVAEDRGNPIEMTHLYAFIVKEDSLTIVKGPFGVGVGSEIQNGKTGCSGCGLPYFNGNRCVTCGQIYDD